LDHTEEDAKGCWCRDQREKREGNKRSVLWCMCIITGRMVHGLYHHLNVENIYQHY